MKRLITSTGALSLTALCALLLVTPTSQASDDTPFGRYLECLNSQTKGSDNKNSDRIINADRVLEACADERQAVLDSMPEKTALTQLARIENHLKGRENHKEKTTKDE